MVCNLQHMKQYQQSLKASFRQATPGKKQRTFDLFCTSRPIILFVALAMGAASGCKTSNNADEEVTGAAFIDEPINGIAWRYLALGDSYTIGQSVDASDRWPVQLQVELEANMTTKPFENVTILATTGWTTSNLAQALSNSGYEEETWDLVSLLIGVNNQFQGVSLEQYEVEFEDLLHRAIAAANEREERVFVVSIPDYGYTPFGEANQAQISGELETFNASCKAIAESYGVAHFDITDISQQWPDVDGLIAEDGLHPSRLHYSLWIESFHDSVRALLEP